MKENANNYDDDLYGDEEGEENKSEEPDDGEDLDENIDEQAMPNDQGVVNLANFIANATKLEELNIKRNRDHTDFEITGLNENEEFISITNLSATNTDGVVRKQRRSF